MDNLATACIFVLTVVATVSSNSFYSSLTNIYVTNFQLTKCDTTIVDPLAVEDIVIQMKTSNHVHISGTLMAFENLTAPIKASVTLKKKVLFGWIHVPCERKMGSCDYDDLCSYGYPANKECPPDFAQHGIPCRCPIPKGNYTLPPTAFQILDDRSVLTGKYKGNVYITHQNERLACYNMNFALQEK